MLETPFAEVVVAPQASAEEEEQTWLQVLSVGGSWAHALNARETQTRLLPAWGHSGVQPAELMHSLLLLRFACSCSTDLLHHNSFAIAEFHGMMKFLNSGRSQACQPHCSLQFQQGCSASFAESQLQAQMQAGK